MKKIVAILVVTASILTSSCDLVRECCGSKTSNVKDSTGNACSTCGGNSCNANCASNPSSQKK